MKLSFTFLAFCVIGGCWGRPNFEENICSFASCKCISDAHPSWVTVNCTVPPNQRLSIRPHDLPPATSDLVVNGGDALLLNTHSLSALSDVRQIFFHRIKDITIQKMTAVGLPTINLYIEIDNCENLKIEGKAFSKIKGPLSIEINNCGTVTLEGEALSWLLMINISNVRELKLSDGSFKLDPSAGNVGDHGPGMSININHVQVPEIPSRTFGSSAASVVMQAVTVGTIKQGAFSANTYNIVMALNCSVQYIEAEAFAQKSLINSLSIVNCNINELGADAMRSAVAKMNITGSKFDVINKGAINATVVSVTVTNSVFHVFYEQGFVLSSWNKIYMNGNKFDVLSPNAILAPGGSVDELVFTENEIETVYPGSLGFVGPAYAKYPFNIVYKQNYYGHPCHCNITDWIAQAMGITSAEYFADESLCTVDYFFAICFNVPERNVRFDAFTKKVCTTKPEIQCEEILSKKAGAVYTEMPNPRFPHKKPDKSDVGLNERDKKVIGIVIVTAIGCIIIVMIISFIRWMRRRGHCLKLKNALISYFMATCGTICDKMNICGQNTTDNIRSMSQLSVVEYSEHQRLNEPRTQEVNQEPVATNELPSSVELVAMADKITQTLPEELTRDLLENLKVKLEDPENYTEARELIEHLYDLIKYEDKCKTQLACAVENIYELPFQSTAPRVGKNKKQMKSVGTKTPSIENLLPLSPYHRRTALAHEYFEPKDFAVHLYAEIVNYDKEKKTKLGSIPDVVAEQGMPRGPYLRSVREKNAESANNSPTGKMLNRPLPQKPASVNYGEGSSIQHG